MFGRVMKCYSLQQLLALFIHANHWAFLAITKGIQFQEIIHPPPVFRRNPAYAPHLLEPRLTLVFFKISLTLSRFTPPNPSRWRAAWVSNVNVQCSRPSGGLLQANATISDCSRILYFIGRPGRGMS